MRHPLHNLHDSETNSFTFGTSVYQPVDDPTGWPNLLHRDATPDEINGLKAKLAYLQGVADDVKEQLVPSEGDSPDCLVELIEDEGVSAIRFFVPVSLVNHIFGSLSIAAACLEAAHHVGAVAQLRVAEMALRFVMTWGHGEVEALVEGAMGLDAGEKTAVVFETEVELVPDGQGFKEAVRRITHEG